MNHHSAWNPRMSRDPHIHHNNITHRQACVETHILSIKIATIAYKYIDLPLKNPPDDDDHHTRPSTPIPPLPSQLPSI